MQAQVSYTGNGNSNFGGTVGGSSLNLSDDGTTLTFAFTRGGSTLDNIVVIYIDSKTGGFSDTSTLQDAQDGGRRATSSYTGTQGTLVTFPSGFEADYAVTFANNFAVGFELVAGGNNSHNVVGSAAISPSGNNAATTHNVTINWADLGISATDNFKFIVTYISDSGFMSDEVIGDSSVSGNPGFNGSLTFTGNRTYPNTWTGAASTNFNDGGNWSNGTIDTNDNLFIPSGLGTYPTLSATTSTPSIVVKSGASLTVASNLGLTVTGNFNNAGTTTVNSGGSLIVGGTSTGNLTYNRNLSTLNQWYLVSSPFSGETIADMRTSHTFVSGTEDTDHLSFAPYNNAATVSTERWDYITASSTGTLGDAQGYLAQLNAVGNISFTGTMNTSDFTAIDLTDNSGSSGTAFNFLGNPYPSFIDIGDLLTANDSGGNDLLTEATVWIWNGSSYDQRNSGTASPNDYIAPAQGFFVSADGGSSTFTITEAMQSHQGTDSFQKSANTRTELQLIINDGTNRKDADIFYIDGTSTGFDNGYDSSIFSGVENKFAIYTEAVANGTGKKLGIQSLPNSDLESMVIPVGIIADAGEITFSAETVNFPSELKVFLEDRQNNIFTRLDEANSSYAVTLTEKTDGIGRFYLHTNSSALSTDNVQLENISIYKANASTLRIVGLSQGKANVKLFNILGEQVLNRNFTSNGVYDVNLPQLATGVYIAQLENENGTINKKIVLE